MALQNPIIVSEQARGIMENSELPDCVISYIFSKLDTKNMAKTSVLSKRWRHEWIYKKEMDFSFDMYDMFNLSQITSMSNMDFLNKVNEFGRKVGKCINRYKGTKIRSIRVCFSFGHLQHSYCFVNKLISEGAAKGMERIELLLFKGNGTYEVPYLYARKLPKCDSLKYLHLRQSDFVLPIIDFSGFKNLQTLVLQKIVFEEDILLGLFSNYIHLKNVTLLECYFNIQHDINIISTKLCLLVIVDCRYLMLNNTFKIIIDAVNLLSFEYNCPITLSSIKAPRLLKFFWSTFHDHEKKQSPFPLIATLPQIQDLVLSINRFHASRLFRNFGPFQNVRQLDISLYGQDLQGCLQISDIAMASPYLQKLVLTNCLPHLIFPNMTTTYQIGKRKHRRISYNELKYVELRGCIGPMNGIELARHFLKNAKSLKQITFCPRARFYIGAEKWSETFECSNCMGCNLLCEMLKDEANGKCHLVIW